MIDDKSTDLSEELISSNVSEGLATNGSIHIEGYVSKYLLTIVNNLKIVNSPDSKQFTTCVNWAVRRKHLLAHKFMYEIQPSTNKIHCHVIVTVSNEKVKYTLQRAICRKFGKGYRVHFQKITDKQHYENCLDYQKLFKSKLHNCNQQVLATYDKIRKAKLGICPWHYECSDFTENEAKDYIKDIKKKCTVTFW